MAAARGRYASFFADVLYETMRGTPTKQKPANFVSKCLNALKGLGTDDEVLIRTIAVLSKVRCNVQ